MRNLILIFCISLTYLSLSANPREKIAFNDGWKFKLADQKEYCTANYDDSEWRTLSLPHDWSIEGQFSEEHSGRNAWLPGGIAWYRKAFKLPAKFEGKNIQIQFDGVYKNSTLWVNGHPVGRQHDGYTSFYFDISELLNAGESNTIAVRVDNSVQPNCRWYSGSGIYRNVWLNISNKTHVATWGTFITTPSVRAKEASIQVVTTIENFNEAVNLDVETILVSQNGEEVARTSSKLTIKRLRQAEIEQNLTIANPQLWSVDAPALYTAITQLKEGNELIDEYTSKFGVRTIEFDADKGFFLNGHNMKMKGVCLHHEAGALGAAVPEEIWRNRLLKLKAIGCNAIRTAHNPASVEFLDLCDELGFLVMNEFVDKWENPYKEPKAKRNHPFFDMPFADLNFDTEWEKNFGETIKRDRNHPSVIIWSVGNENHSPGTNEQNHGLKKYTSFVRTMDPSRPVISGMERGRDCTVDQKVDDIIESCQFMDLIALNYGEQWCKLIADKKPGKPYVSTESYTYFNSALEKRFANIERSPWLDVMENESNMGLFLWVGFDYLGESKTWGQLGTNCGLFSTAGFRKEISYLYESFWSDKPVLHIEVYEGDADDFSTSGRWWWPPMHNHWNQKEGSVVDLVTYTNCETVDLYLNDKKIGTQKLADCPNWIMKWRKITHEAGTLIAVGKIGGKVVCETKLETSTKPQKLVLSSNVEQVLANGIALVEVTLTDKKGRAVRADEQQLKFEITGDAKILSLDNGNMKRLVPFTNTQSLTTHEGNCLCIIKFGTKPEEVELTVSGEGLKTSKLTLK